jgi:hypothetical protein
MVNWFVNGVDQMVMQCFFVSTDGGKTVVPLANPTSTDIGTRDIDATFALDANGSTAELFFRITGPTGGVYSSDMVETVTVTAGTQGLTLRVYEYCNFRLNNTADDQVQMSNANTVDQYDPSLHLSETVATPPPTHHEVGFAANVLADVLNGNNLNDVNGPVGLGDVAWAFQFDMVLAAGDSNVISKDKRLSPDDRFFVPEPVTMLGMFLGLGGIGAYIRKRRMA